MLEIFRKMNIEDRIISFLVENMKQDTTQKLFYGKPQKAGAVLKPLRETLYPEKAFASNKQCRTAILFYAQVWIRSHGGLSPEFMKKMYGTVLLQTALKAAQAAQAIVMSSKQRHSLPTLQNSATTAIHSKTGISHWLMTST